MDEFQKLHEEIQEIKREFLKMVLDSKFGRWFYKPEGLLKRLIILILFMVATIIWGLMDKHDYCKKKSPERVPDCMAFDQLR